ncbi:hypothetical protein [Butyrivibrio sp. VCD2006]|uniref:hypothetical protein n=1 Tax=Butyrivibrio sp. VCD2006 TaxID=1280664 RepID=UPI00040CCCA0|nr:hypothetical protein [Butyrivibrio sp. VCD2006]
MIEIQDIPIENINDFWKLHIKYLVDDEISEDEEDKEYFEGDEYDMPLFIKKIFTNLLDLALGAAFTMTSLLTSGGKRYEVLY